MDKVELLLQSIPHGHGLSFKKGLADGLLDSNEHKSTTHETHAASYRRGVDVGIEMKRKIAEFVKT
jgi:hypothetical protein